MLSPTPSTVVPLDGDTPDPHLLRERAVTDRAREFDATALLDALDDLGYRDEDIVLRSRHGSSRGHSLFHAVEFEKRPRRRALVTVNLGLLGSESPLPSYIAKLIERSPDRLVPFFEYFDHSLLRSRFRALWPERDRELGSDWTSTRRSMSKLVRLDTPAMGHWLFRHVYPELEVAVRRAPTLRTIPTEPIRLSRSAIGDGSALGGTTEVWCGGLAATLVANEPESGNGKPWQEEAARRMKEQLLPQLLDSDISLTVTLIIRDRPSMLRLAPNSFLGLQPLQSGSNATKVLIFDGPIQSMGATTAMLGQPMRAPAEGAETVSPTLLIAASSAPRHGNLPAAASPADEASQVANIDAYLSRLR
jgi:hypothetical protein